MRPTETDPEESMDEIALRELISTLLTQLKSVEAERYEARKLLREVPWLHEKIPLNDFATWITRRDAFLNPSNKDVM